MHNRPFLQEAPSTIVHWIGQLLGLILLFVAGAGLFTLLVGLFG